MLFGVGKKAARIRRKSVTRPKMKYPHTLDHTIHSHIHPHFYHIILQFMHIILSYTCNACLHISLIHAKNILFFFLLVLSPLSFIQLFHCFFFFIRRTSSSRSTLFLRYVRYSNNVKRKLFILCRYSFCVLELHFFLSFASWRLPFLSLIYPTNGNAHHSL